MPPGESTGKRHREVKKLKSNASYSEAESVISHRGLSVRKSSARVVGVRDSATSVFGKKVKEPEKPVQL